MRNLPEWVVSFWAGISLGAIVVPLNAWWTAEELAYGLTDSGSSVAIVDVERLARLRPQLDELDGLHHVIVSSEDRQQPIDLGPPHDRIDVIAYDELLAEPDPAVELPEVELLADDDATIFYTSGTTGKPKGAVGSHRNAVANMMNLFFVTSRTQLRFGAATQGSEASSPNSYLLSVPLFHATGCLAILVVNTAAGGKLVIMHHFDAEPGMPPFAVRGDVDVQINCRAPVCSG